MTAELWADAVLAYLIQYLGLGSVFFFGLWVAWRQGDVGLKGRRQRLWLGLLAGGYLLYAGIHGFFQFCGPSLQ
jgi:hypothetical protein